jgi:hypothetical protein
MQLVIAVFAAYRLHLPNVCIKKTLIQVRDEHLIPYEQGAFL